MKKRDIEMEKEKFYEFLDASQIVCMECAYASEKDCDKCPVRKTLDRIVEHFLED